MSLRSYRRVVAVAFASLWIIIVTGALVRITGSGLGCVDWPACNESRFIDVSTGHAAIEQLNRLFTGVVAASVAAAVLAGVRVRPRVPGLVPLAVGLVVGVLAQVVIGGIVVRTGLNPWSNVAHYLVSVLLVTGAWALWRRTAFESVGRSAGASAGASDEGAVTSWRWIVVALGAAAVVAGTIVTGSGPHAGDERAVRIGVQIRDASRVHGAIVWAFLASVAWLGWRARRNPEIRRAASVLIGLGAAQTAIGYAQYALGLPIGLVAVHVAGSIAVWVATLSLWRASGGFGVGVASVVD